MMMILPMFSGVSISFPESVVNLPSPVAMRFGLFQFFFNNSHRSCLLIVVFDHPPQWPLRSVPNVRDADRIAKRPLLRKAVLLQRECSTA